MAYTTEDFKRLFYAVLGIDYDPVWPYAERCLYWYQRPFAAWLIDQTD